MTRFLIAGWLGWAGLCVVPWLQAAAPGAHAAPATDRIPYVPTRHDAVKDLLWLGGVGTNDVVYDLGSGDGRVVIAAVRDFGARWAVGIELDSRLVQKSREQAAAAGVADRCEFIQGDLFTNDISPASVVVLYLGHGANIDLRARLLRSLKPGARVVSHQFGMGEWPADKLLDVRTVVLGMYGEAVNEFRDNPEVPDFDGTGSRARHDVISGWIVPAPVAGTWRGQIRLETEDRELRITLHQRLSEVRGSFVLAGPTNVGGWIEADVWADHVRCWCVATNQAPARIGMWLDGHATDDTLTGTLWVSQGQATREWKWVGQRDKSDLTGTWEWSGPTNLPVQLKIERRDGRLAATYADKNRAGPAYRGEKQPIAVTDFYDFGGGFYFTLLLGLEGNSLARGGRRVGPQDGWLVGEAVTQGDTLKGTIAFYSYSIRGAGYPGQLDKTSTLQTGRHAWQAKRVAP